MTEKEAVLTINKTFSWAPVVYTSQASTTRVVPSQAETVLEGPYVRTIDFKLQTPESLGPTTVIYSEAGA